MSVINTLMSRAHGTSKL